MDWIEEKIEQLRISLKEKSLVKALVCYLCIGMAGVLTLCWITRNLCQAWVEVISRRYQESMILHSAGAVKWYVCESAGGREELLLNLANFLEQYCLYLYSLFCFCLVGTLFLEKKIKPAINAVAQGIKYINLGDYGHEVAWSSQDEMGLLCREMEQMRKALLKGKRNQWRQQEEQRKINAAFAHDIRTPLTVIRGYTEFLQKYIPQGKVSEEMLLDKLAAIHEQEERLLRFSATMSTIQKIEKWEISGNWHRVSELIGQMESVIEGISQNAEKVITLHTQVVEQKLLVDKNLLIEVFENLLSNAVRYACKHICVQVVLHGTELTVFVRDDGPGFSDRALRSGMDTYFSEEENSGDHFGIGLSISRMLCENHGGSLTLQNSVEQGAICAAVLAVGTEGEGGNNRREDFCFVGNS
ncbi:HAMP domain-containing sensor histidine kinase [Lachnospiraceae bacterium 45-W7]